MKCNIQIQILKLLRFVKYHLIRGNLTRKCKYNLPKEKGNLFNI